MALYVLLAKEQAMAAQLTPETQPGAAIASATLQEACMDALTSNIAALASGPTPVAPTHVPFVVGTRQCQLWYSCKAGVSVLLVMDSAIPVPDAAPRSLLLDVLRRLRPTILFGSPLPPTTQLEGMLAECVRQHIPQPVAGDAAEQGDSDTVNGRIRSRLLGLKRLVTSGALNEGRGAEMLGAILKRRKLNNAAAPAASGPGDTPPGNRLQLVDATSSAEVSNGAGRLRQGESVPSEGQVSVQELWKLLSGSIVRILNASGGDVQGGWQEINAMLRRRELLPTSLTGYKKLLINVRLLFAGHCRHVKQMLASEEKGGAGAFLPAYLRVWSTLAVVAKHLQDIFVLRFHAVQCRDGGGAGGPQPDIFNMAMQSWREHVVVGESGLASRLTASVGNLLEKWDSGIAVQLLQSLLLLADPGLLRTIILEPYTRFLSGLSYDFDVQDGDEHSVRQLLVWVDGRLAEERKRLESLTVACQRDDGLIATLNGAGFSCNTKLLGDVEEMAATLLGRLEVAGGGQLRNLAQAHVEPLVVAALPLMLQKGNWDVVRHIAATFGLWGGQKELQKGLFNQIRKEREAIGLGEGCLAFVRRMWGVVAKYEENLPGICGGVDEQSGLTLLEKILFSVLDLSDAAGILVGALREANFAAADVSVTLSLLRFVRQKDAVVGQIEVHVAAALLECLDLSPGGSKGSALRTLYWPVAKQLRLLFGSSCATSLEAILQDSVPLCLPVEGGKESVVEEDEEAEPDIVIYDSDDEAETVCQVAVVLCQSGHWPRRVVAPFLPPPMWGPSVAFGSCYHLPDPVADLWDAFQQHYVAQHPQRRLTLLPHLGAATCLLRQRGSTVTLHMGTTTMLVLASMGGIMSLKEIVTATRLPDGLVRCVIAGLLSGQRPLMRIHSSEPAARVSDMAEAVIEEGRKLLVDEEKLRAAFDAADRFEINPEFNGDSGRTLTLPSVVELGSNFEVEERQMVESRRASLIDAAITRTLRQGPMEEMALLQRVMGMLKMQFVPLPTVVKARVSRLESMGILAYDVRSKTLLRLVRTRELAAK